MNLAIIGTGYVGLVTGTCFAELGNNVVCVDIDQTKIAKLQKGDIPIYEPGLEELVRRNLKEKRLHFSTSALTAIENSDVIFSAVQTPPGKNQEADLSFVSEVARTFAKHLNSYKIFVNKSTVPVGTSIYIKKIIEEINQNQCQFDIADNPEFLREGTAIKDFMNPDRIVIGVESERARIILNKLYHPFVSSETPIIFTDIASAEIIKYASNAFLATKISFINEVANFCEAVGADVKEVAKGIGLDQRIGARFLNAGIGYGGSCFPKDVKAFIHSARKVQQRFQILEAVEAVNQKQKTIIVEKLLQLIPHLPGKKIVIWGLSFKPHTDDMREAASIPIIQELCKQKAEIHVFDPVATNNARHILKNIAVTYHNEAYTPLKNAHALVILTEWDEFLSADLDKIAALMKQKIIIDGRNIYEPTEMAQKGFIYHCIGRPAFHQERIHPPHLKVGEKQISLINADSELQPAPEVP